MADRIFYVEERGFDGRFHPALYHGDMPALIRSDGPRKVFRAAPIEIAVEHHRMSMETLQAIYGGIITKQERGL